MVLACCHEFSVCLLLFLPEVCCDDRWHSQFLSYPRRSFAQVHVEKSLDVFVGAKMSKIRFVSMRMNFKAYTKWCRSSVHVGEIRKVCEWTFSVGIHCQSISLSPVLIKKSAHCCVNGFCVLSCKLNCDLRTFFY